jgi:glycosyltransferase involved in cell wall biosynthesis
MRVLFLHCSLAWASEYNSQRTLAENADFGRIEPYFVWQKHTIAPDRDEPARLPRPEQNLFLDFGRDLDVPAWPPRVGRALRMARHAPSSLPALLRHAREVRPDVVYSSQQTFDVYLSKLVASLLRIPQIIHVHYPVGPWLGPGIVTRIRRADHLVAASDFIRREAINAGASPDRVQVQHEAVPLDRYTIPRGVWKIREEFGLEPGCPLVVAVGRLDPSKRIDLLLRAFAQVLGELPAARLLICGASSAHDRYDLELRRLATELNLDRKAMFAGMRRDVPAIMAEANVFSLPTELDACPLVFMEAMAASLPAIAVTSGGVPEMVVHGETGLLSSPGDVEGLANNLFAVLHDPATANRMGEAGRRRVFAEFAPQKAGPKWTRTVEHMLLA